MRLCYIVLGEFTALIVECFNVWFFCALRIECLAYTKVLLKKQTLIAVSILMRAFFFDPLLLEFYA